MKALKILTVIALCAVIFSAFMYTAAFAASSDEDCVVISEELQLCDNVCYAVTDGTSAPGFNEFEKEIYNQLMAKAADIAGGTLSSSQFDITVDIKWTKADLGCDTLISNGALTSSAQNAIKSKFAELIDQNYLFSVMLINCPYELFWFDKSVGASYSYEMKAYSDRIEIPSLKFSFTVSSDYGYGYEVDSGKISSAKQAVANAKAIVERYEGMSDYEKLIGYKNEICELVSYNFDVLESDASYGNPWQMIYVFDGDSSTDVVCEGYSKAFKYLCDLTDFDGEVYCYLTSGLMIANKSEEHMWNVVNIGGANYLVDVTNTDSTNGSGGFDLFLVGATSSDGEASYTVAVNGNTIKSISYEYSEGQKDLICEGYLAISSYEYHKHSFASEWSDDGVSHWRECFCGVKTDISNHSSSVTECTVGAACTVCNLEYTAHVYNRQVATDGYLNTAATCTERATYFYSCDCGEKGSESFESGDLASHSYDSYGECEDCGAYDEENILDGGYDDYLDDSVDEVTMSFFDWLLEMIISFIESIFALLFGAE